MSKCIHDFKGADVCGHFYAIFTFIRRVHCSSVLRYSKILWYKYKSQILKLKYVYFVILKNS